MLSFTDPIGRVDSFVYDDREIVISETEPGGATRYFSYAVDASRVHSTQLTELDGAVTNFIFDDNYRLIKTTTTDGAFTNQVWNSKNLLDSTTDAFGFITSMQYDERGNLTSIIRPADSLPTTISYDQSFNKPNAITPPVGAATNFTIDQVTGDVIQVSRNNLSLNFSMDQFGNILTTNNGIQTYADQTNGNGLKTLVFDSRNPETRSYDLQGRVIARSFKNGRLLSYSYDNYDRVIQIKDSNGPTINNTFDILGRLTSRTVSGIKNSEVTKYEWDIRGRLVKITDNLGRQTSYQYNLVMDKPLSITSPDGKVTIFKYNNMQRLVQKIDAKNNSTFFEYDLRGDVTKLTDAKGNFTLFFYDANRRLIKQDSPTVLTDNKGISSSAREIALFTYNDRDQLIKKEESLASGTGKKTVTILSYDSLDRIIGKTITKDNQVQVSSFSYEPILDATLLKTANNEVEKLSFSYEDPCQPPKVGQIRNLG